MGAADHLQVPRQHGLFFHHGIDLGDGYVAHYLEGKEILKSSIDDFCLGQNFSIVKHKNASSHPQTLMRAKSRIGEQKYNLLFNNCEHFACWCKTGKHRSKQLDDWLKTSIDKGKVLNQIMPTTLDTALKLIEKYGVTGKSALPTAKKAVIHLRNLRESLISKLDWTLEELETWFDGNSKTNQNEGKRQIKQSLVLKGQALADQLNSLESLEGEIIRLLNKTNSQN